MHPAVFLDRDNTLIRNDGDLGDPERVQLIQGAASAVASLRGLGYRVVVVTNQGGVARGRYKERDVEAVHARLNDLIAYYANGARIDAFYFCPYHPEGNLKQYRKDHPDRKPQPGMLLRAAEELELDLPRSWTVGDQVRDVQAGAAAGTRTILLRVDAERLAHIDPGELRGLSPELAEAGTAGPRRIPDFFAHDLVEAVRIIAQQRKPEAPADPKLAGKFHGRKWDAAAIAELQRTGRPPQDVHEPSADAEESTLPAEAPAAETHAPEAAPQRSGSEAAEPRSAEAKEGARAFRPWGTPEPRAYIDTPIARAIRARRKATEERQHADAAPTPEPPPAEDAARAAPDADVKPPAPSAEPPGVAASSAASPPAASPSVAEGAAPDPRRVEGSSPETARLLRQILQELRSQRGEVDDFSSLTVVAIVLQMAAALCLVGALWMGAEDVGLFARWMGAGLLVQLATIALLLFSRQR